MSSPPGVQPPSRAPSPPDGCLVIVVANQKGGVGKTTIALALAAEASKTHRTLVVDVDPQASAYDLSQMSVTAAAFDVVQELDPAQIARMRDAGYSRIFVDCPGSLEGERVLDQVLTQADYVIVPYDGLPASKRPTYNTVEYVQRHGVPFRVLLNSIPWGRGAGFIHDAWARLDADSVPSFPKFLRQYAAWSTAQGEGVSILDYRGGNASNARMDLTEVTRSLNEDLGRLAAGV